MENGIRTDTANLFEQLYNSYYKRLVAFATARLGEYRECAEDCVQDAFIVLQSKLN